MAEISLKALEMQIKEDALSNFYCIYGDEYRLLQKARSQLKNVVPLDDQEMDFMVIDLNETDVKGLLIEFNTPPFYGDKKVIFVENTKALFENKLPADLEKKLIAGFENPLKSNIVVFFVDKLDKRKKLSKTLQSVANELVLNKLEEKDAKAAIYSFLKNHGYEIEPNALELLIRRTNADYSLMYQEVLKLMNYVKEDKIIKLEAVDGLVAKVFQDSVFDLSEAVIKKDVKKAITVYHELIDNRVEAIAINRVLLSQFRLMLQIIPFYEKNDFEISKILAVHPYRVKLAKQLINAKNMMQIIDQYLFLVEIEKKLKSTNRNSEQLFEEFIYQNVIQ